MKINAIFTRKESELNPKECIIEHNEIGIGTRCGFSCVLRGFMLK